jgi:hypothetical protein
MGRNDVAAQAQMKTTSEILFENGIATKSSQTGRHYTTCPRCSSKRIKPHQKLKCLGVTIKHDGVKFGCNHCGWTGGGYFDTTGTPDPVKLARARAETAERDRILRAKRLGLAHWLWAKRKPLAGSIAETYLREARGYGGPLPATLGFLPGRGEHPPAMIASFGIATEIEPGVLAIADAAVRGVHLTRLLPDGSGKATFEEPDEQAKITIGYSVGSPICLAASNDSLGMAITEGIEDALSAHEATGLGAWAAGCASRMPALAAVLPAWTDCATVIADDDKDGRRHATELARLIRARGIAPRLIVPGASRRRAA